MCDFPLVAARPVVGLVAGRGGAGGMAGAEVVGGAGVGGGAAAGAGDGGTATEGCGGVAGADGAEEEGACIGFIVSPSPRSASETGEGLCSWHSFMSSSSIRNVLDEAVRYSMSASLQRLMAA